MGTFLQVLGAIFLLLLLYVGFRLAVLIGKAALIIYGVKKFVTSGLAAGMPPTVRLERVLGADWSGDPEAEALAAPLAGLGYEEVGFFDLEILGGTRLQAWVHPGLGCYAIVYRAGAAGAWSDVVTKYQDDTSLTYTNTPRAGVLKQRPGRENVSFPGLGTDELHRRMVIDRPDRPTRDLSAADFAADFERAYAEEMAWRGSPEGFDPDSVGSAQALAGVMTGRFSPEQTRQVRESMVRKMYLAVAQGLKSSYRDAAGLSDEAWAEVEPRLVFVWDAMNIESLRAELAGWGEIPQRDRLDNFLDDPYGGEDQGYDHARQAFADLNAEVPEGLRLVKVGEVPLKSFGDPDERADVYHRPAP